jgi:hypothetical protein
MMKYVLILFLMSCSSYKIVTKKMDSSSKNKQSFGPTSGEDTVFQDKTELYGLSNIEAENIFVVDFNLDGNDDLVMLPEPYSQPIFYQWDSKRNKFIKVKSRIAASVRASYLLFYDFNGDDILDVLIGVNNQKLKIRPVPLTIFFGEKVSDGLAFKKGTVIFNKPVSSMSVIPLDYDRDGDLDLFIGNWYDFSDKNPHAQHDYLLENDKGVFSNKTIKLKGEARFLKERNLYPSATPTYSLSLCDLNNDFKIDILTTSTHRYPNKMWVNTKNAFEDHGSQSGYASDHEGENLERGGGRTFFSLCNDYDNDQLQDIFIGELTHNYDAEGVDRSSILKGKTEGLTPKFWRTELIQDATQDNWHQSDKRAIWHDFNGDGNTDIFIENTGFPPYSRARLYIQNYGNQFVDQSSMSGADLVNPIQSIMLDVNQDGVLDIISLQSNRRDAAIKRRVYVLENQVIPQRNISLELVGASGNRSAIGSLVKVKLKRFSKIITKSVMQQQSFGALPPQQTNRISIPLGEADSFLGLKVRWPSGDEKEFNIKNVKKDGSLQYLCQKTNRIHLSKSECF